MRRLFTFGDSFSKYAWPMWPDILAQSFDYTENYGRPGCDNFFIYYNALSFLLKNELTSNDTVVIQWTEPSRLDYITKGEWRGFGSGSAELLIKNKLGCFVSDDTIHFKSLFYIYSIVELLKKSSCKWLFLFLNGDCLSFNEKLNLENQYTMNLSNFYKNEIAKFENNLISNVTFSEFTDPITVPINIKYGNSSYLDGHPSPAITFAYLRAHVFDKLNNLNISSMKTYSTNSENFLRTKVVNNMLDLSTIENKFNHATYKKIITIY